VLVVDDEPAIRVVARLMLERAGYAVEEAGDAGDAIRRVEEAERPFAVVLLDVTLPDRSGLEVLADLRRLSPRACVVLTSGRPEENLPDHGAEGFLPKPFTRDQLVAAVRAATATTPR
jgi:two-component system cell cycle response regulator CtrA